MKKEETTTKTVPADIEPYTGSLTSRSAVKVNQYGIDGKYIKTFDSIQKAGKELKISYSCIFGCLKGKLKQTHGFQFRKAEQ
jgi:hypothetical protein